MKKYFYTVAILLLMATTAQAQMQVIGSNEVTEALQDGKMTLRQRPMRADDGLIEAERLIVQGECVKAMPILDEVLKRNLKTIDAYVFKAHCNIMLNNLSKAENDLRTAIRLDNFHMGANYYLGKIHVLEDDLNKAENQLSTLKLICKGTECPEYKMLETEILEFNTEESKFMRDKTRARKPGFGY